MDNNCGKRDFFKTCNFTKVDLKRCLQLFSQSIIKIECFIESYHFIKDNSKDLCEKDQEVNINCNVQSRRLLSNYYPSYVVTSMAFINLNLKSFSTSILILQDEKTLTRYPCQ